MLPEFCGRRVSCDLDGVVLTPVYIDSAGWFGIVLDGAFVPGCARPLRRAGLLIAEGFVCFMDSKWL